MIYLCKYVLFCGWNTSKLQYRNVSYKTSECGPGQSDWIKIVSLVLVSQIMQFI